jgi:hypothetical protein
MCTFPFFNLGVLVNRKTWFCIVVLIVSVSRADEDEKTFRYEGVEIPVTLQQLKNIESIRDHSRPEISRQEADVKGYKQETSPITKELHSKLQELESARDAKIEALLTPDQLRIVRETHLKKLREKVTRDIAYLRDFGSVVAELANAETLVAYEGLPRKDEDEDETKAKPEIDGAKTFQIDGFDFFTQPLTVSPKTVEQFRRVVADYRSFESYGGPYFCGGYHPDLCLEWRTNGQVYRVCICFGCYEARIIGPKKTLMFDIDDAAYKNLYQIAKTVFKHRHLEAEHEP